MEGRGHSVLTFLFCYPPPLPLLLSHNYVIGITSYLTLLKGVRRSDALFLM